MAHYNQCNTFTVSQCKIMPNPYIYIYGAWKLYSVRIRRLNWTTRRSVYFEIEYYRYYVYPITKTFAYCAFVILLFQIFAHDISISKTKEIEIEGRRARYNWINPNYIASRAVRFCLPMNGWTFLI